MSAPRRKPNRRQFFMKHHRWLTLVLALQLLVWLSTALGMALIPRAATTAYNNPPAPFDAAATFPELAALKAANLDAAAITMAPTGARPLAAVTPRRREGAETLVDTAMLAAPAELTPEDIAALARALTGEAISADDVTVKRRTSPEYQKRPIPAYRVEADKAVLFFDPVTGALLGQTTPAQLLENWLTTIHVMDYTGNAEFRANVALTIFALIFLTAALMGVLPFRRLYLAHKGGLRAMRWHQALGLLLAIQVFFWVSSGLGVVWLLHPLRDHAHATMAEERAPVDWSRVHLHPAELEGGPDGAPRFVTLTMQDGAPVYQARWPGRGGAQQLWSAETGQVLTLDTAARDRIAAARLRPDVAASITGWETAAGPEDLDYFFYTGPWPVWRGSFTAPANGVVAIDQITGHVHTPRTGPEVGLEKYYKTHVVYWREGVIKYRQEPVLLAVIGIAFALLFTGAWLHLRRMRLKRS